MAWSLVRLGLFTGAFSIGMLLSHSGLLHRSVSTAVLNENAGASLVVACDDGSMIVRGLKAGGNAVQLHCVQSNMVVVRDHSTSENVPALSPANVRPAPAVYDRQGY